MIDSDIITAKIVLKKKFFQKKCIFFLHVPKLMYFCHIKTISK